MPSRTFAMRIALAILTLAAAVAHAAGPGEKLYNEFVETGQIYGDEAWQSYVRRLGDRLLAQSKDAGQNYHFHVLDNSVVNAFATGDRYIFINRGLIAFLGSEDELAAVIGHEIGHVVARHTRRQRTANIFGKGVGIVAAILTGAGNLYQVSDAATKAYVSGYGREMELEADRLGGEFLARAGYNPLAMIDVVQVLKDQELFAKRVERRPTTYHGLFASHPKNDKRLHDAVAYAQNLLPETTTEPVGDFWELIDGLMYGDEAVMGRVIGTRYYHGGLRVVVEFPEQWSIANPKAAISATAPGGREAAHIEIGRHPWQKRQSPEKFLTERLRRDDIVSGEAVEINGMEGYVGETSTEGSDAKLKMIGVLYRAKDVFLFTGAAGPKGDPKAFRADFLATMHALRNMTPEDAQLANERRIKVIVAEPDVTYADLARHTPIQRFPEETLRLMNAGHPHGEPRAGNYIK
ncbi:MAG: M48 family metalloprotease, partial [Alphaproteobacteria bacterium]|nr:M48 family metalloprotease [Alphaproteobacteria bacterium]